MTPEDVSIIKIKELLYNLERNISGVALGNYIRRFKGNFEMAVSSGQNYYSVKELEEIINALKTSDFRRLEAFIKVIDDDVYTPKSKKLVVGGSIPTEQMTIYIDMGGNSATEIAEFMFALSELNKSLGGNGVEFADSQTCVELEMA